MPIYEYKCQKCGYKFEELVLGEKNIKCPKCKSTVLKKLVSCFGTNKKTQNSCSNGTCDTCPTCNFNP